MKIKTNELTGAALDWAVAKCEDTLLDSTLYQYSTDWAWGGPIIEREIAKIERWSDALWEATAFTRNAQDIVQNGSTPLVAAMRCYVGLRLGNEVNVPDELTEGATA